MLTLLVNPGINHYLCTIREDFENLANGLSTNPLCKTPIMTQDISGANDIICRIIACILLIITRL